MPEETSAPTPALILKLLVANRGEIAIRVFRTARELGVCPPRLSALVAL